MAKLEDVEDSPKPKRLSPNFWIITAALLGIGFGCLGTWLYISRYNMPPAQIELGFPKKQIKVDVNAGYFVIKEFGVRFKPDSSQSDLVYVYKAASKSIYFSTSGLTKLDPMCAADKTSIGAMGQYGLTDEYRPGVKISATAAKKVGNYYYLFESPQSYCSNDDAVNTKQTAVTAMLKKNINDTLEAAK